MCNIWDYINIPIQRWSLMHSLISFSNSPNAQPENEFRLQTCMSESWGLCGSTRLWERSPLHWDLCAALGLGAAVCRDFRGLLPLLRNAMCVMLVWPLGGLGVLSAGSRSRELTVNESPALTSVSCICFQIRGLVSRSSTPGFSSLPFKCQSEKLDPIHPTQSSSPKIHLQNLVCVVCCSWSCCFGISKGLSTFMLKMTIR